MMQLRVHMLQQKRSHKLQPRSKIPSTTTKTWCSQVKEYITFFQWRSAFRDFLALLPFSTFIWTFSFLSLCRPTLLNIISTASSGFRVWGPHPRRYKLRQSIEPSLTQSFRPYCRPTQVKRCRIPHLCYCSQVVPLTFW